MSGKSTGARNIKRVVCRSGFGAQSRNITRKDKENLLDWIEEKMVGFFCIF